MLLSVAGNDENTCCECNGASELEEPDDDRPREPNPKRTIVIAVAVIVAVVVVVAVAAAKATIMYRNRTPTIAELRRRLDAIRARLEQGDNANVHRHLPLPP